MVGFIFFLLLAVRISAIIVQRAPTAIPTRRPTSPTCSPTRLPTKLPTACPSRPTNRPTARSTLRPTNCPTRPTRRPTATPSYKPSAVPSTAVPTRPTSSPTRLPTKLPSACPSRPTNRPTARPTLRPTNCPTRPTRRPTATPSYKPSAVPSTITPTRPTCSPTRLPTKLPSACPSRPTLRPTSRPTLRPTNCPTRPSRRPTATPSYKPSAVPSTIAPTRPTCSPTRLPTKLPSACPSRPTNRPTVRSTFKPTNGPTRPSCSPTVTPSLMPTTMPSLSAAPTFCPPGYFVASSSSSNSNTSCSQCPLNTYSDSGNVCTHCPTGFVTGGVASIGENYCINPNTNFILGMLSLVSCIVIAIVYILFGRLQLLALERRSSIVEESVKVYISVNKVISWTKRWCNEITLMLDQEVREEEKKILREFTATGVYTLAYCKLQVKAISRPILFAVAALITSGFVTVGTIVMATSRVLFNAVLLYRGYRYYINRDFVLLHRIQLFLQELGLGRNFDHIKNSIAYFINWLSSITINLESSLSISCVGSQAPVYLLVDFLITAIVVINISSNFNVIWFTLVSECTTEFTKLLTNRYFLRNSILNSLTTTMYAIGGLCLRVFPSPMKINQYLLSFVYISVFFSNNGVSSSNKNCDQATSFPLDSFEAVMTSLLVIFLILPMLYVFSQVLYPFVEYLYEIRENRRSNNKYRSSEQHCCDQGWRYMNAWTSLDWFFVKVLIAYAESLENNMLQFLNSTPEEYSDNPNLKLLSFNLAFDKVLAQKPSHISWLYIYDNVFQKAREKISIKKCAPFLIFQLDILTELFTKDTHIPSTYIKEHWYLRWAFNWTCYLIFPLQLICSEVSLQVWLVVFGNYMGFCFMSLGIWTDEMVIHLSIIENFTKFSRICNDSPPGVTENSILSVKFNPLRMRDDTSEVFLGGDNNYESEQGGSSIGNDLERRAMFIQFLSAMTSCRAVLWQLIPGMTAFAILSVDLSSCPIFIVAESVQQWVPLLIVQNSWDIAMSQFAEGCIGGKGKEKPQTWQLMVLSFCIFVQESRLIQFIIIVVNSSVAFAIVFSSNIKVFVILFFIVNIISSLAQTGYSVLLLHQLFFSEIDDDDDDDDRNHSGSSVKRPLIK